MRTRMLCIIAFITTLVLITACGGTDDSTKRAENEQKLFKAITEYPGDGLYDPDEVVIGLGTEEPTDEDYAKAEEKAAEEKEAWHKAVGDCFADGMFDTFYSEWFRCEYLGIARNSGLTTTMTDFKVEEDEDQDDNVEEVIVTIMAEDQEGGRQSFDMYWQVVFDKDDRSLIQKAEIFDDGGFYNAYADTTME